MSIINLPDKAAGPSREFWVLEDFDPRDSFPARLWRHRDAIRYVVGRVALGLVMDARCREQGRGWVALRWIDLKPLFGRSGTWDEVRRILLDRGILECDESYRVDHKAKGYRLGTACALYNLSRRMILDPETASRIRRLDAVRDDRNSWGPEHHHLLRWLRQITVEEAEVSKWTRQCGRSWRQRLTAMKIAVLRTGEACLSVDPYGRVHSPLVNLRRAVRPALRIHGKRLVEVDISKAQPMLIGYLVVNVVTGVWTMAQVKSLGEKARDDKWFKGYILIRREGVGEEETRGGKEAHRNTLCLPNLHLSPCLSGLPADLVDYLEVCQGGDFYRALADAWGRPCGTRKEKNRIKRLTFQYVMFGPPRPGRRYWEAYRRRWPTVAQVMEAIKAGDHGTAARACQRIESSLMIGGVVERFRVANPDLPIQTIHDSVLVHPEVVDLARTTILDVFGAIGLKPKLKVG
jgi:hypothetical protein